MQDDMKQDFIKLFIFCFENFLNIDFMNFQFEPSYSPKDLTNIKEQ